MCIRDSPCVSTSSYQYRSWNDWWLLGGESDSHDAPRFDPILTLVQLFTFWTVKLWKMAEYWIQYWSNDNVWWLKWVLTRTQEVDSTYWNVFKIFKSIQIAGPKNIQHNEVRLLVSITWWWYVCIFVLFVLRIVNITWWWYIFVLFVLRICSANEGPRLW